MERKNCSECGRPIGFARLRAMPNTNICAKCIAKNRNDIDDEWIDFLDDIEFALSDIDTGVVNKICNVLKSKIEKLMEREKRNKDKEEQLEQKIADFHNDIQVIQYKKDLRAIHQQHEYELRAMHQRHKSDIQAIQQQYEEVKYKFNLLKQLIPNFMDGEIKLYVNQQQKTTTSPDLRGDMVINSSKYLGCNINIVLWKDRQNGFYVGYLNKHGIISNEHKIKLIRTDVQKIKGIVILDGIQYSVLIDIQKNTDSNTDSDKCIQGYIFFYQKQ